VLTPVFLVLPYDVLWPLLVALVLALVTLWLVLTVVMVPPAVGAEVVVQVLPPEVVVAVGVTALLSLQQSTDHNTVKTI
jgi:hypothetical protein